MDQDTPQPTPLHEKFPEMVPITKAPGLSTVDGVGCAMYGKRDYDEETQTYVKTYCFCLLFVPLLALRAYRVADAPTGWYFMGRVPLSALAKAWNLLIVLGLAAAIGGGYYAYHVNHPDTIAANQLAEGDRLAAAGRTGAAAKLYQQVAQGTTARAAEASARFDTLLHEPLHQASPDEMLEALKVALDLDTVRPLPTDVFAAGLEAARRRKDAEPDLALKVLAEIAPANPLAPELLALWQPLLEQAVAKNPNDVDAVSQLAVILESRKDLAAAEKLLVPLRDRLGPREGARILGRIYVEKNNFDDALPLLQAYAEQRLPRLHAAENGFQSTVQRINNEVLQRLGSGKVADFDYARHKQLDDNAARAMVDNYLNEHMRKHPDFLRAQQALRRETGVVPVAFDLGIALLRRGQAMADPEARKAELEKAEKAFVSVRGVAGGTDEFRIFLGQVYYWLGKHQDGRKLFDEFLAGQSRHTRALTAVAQMLRDVGEVTAARELAEEGYKNASDPGNKDHAASLRAVIWLDMDDRIAWLEKCDQNVRRNQAELASARGDKAFGEHKDEECARHLKEAVVHYEALPESADTLNNGAVALRNLFRVTGERKYLERGIANMEKAVALMPRDTVLIANVANAVEGSGLAELIGPAIDLKTLREIGNFELLGYLFNDKAGRDQWRAKVRASAGIAKARQHFERCVVLAPKRPSTYLSLALLYYNTDDLPAMKQLLGRLSETPLDLDELKRAEQIANKEERSPDELRRSVEKWQKTVERARPAGKCTLAVALDRLVRAKITLERLEPDRKQLDEVVKLAREAHEVCPSQATEFALVRAHLVRAHRDLEQSSKEYAAFAAPGQRALAGDYVIPVAMEKDEKLRKLALAHRDVEQALRLLKQAAQAKREAPNAWAWALLRHADPPLAKQLAAEIGADQMSAATLKLSEHIRARNPADAYRGYWNYLVRGQDAQAHAWLQQCREQGMKVPWEMK